MKPLKKIKDAFNSESDSIGLIFIFTSIFVLLGICIFPVKILATIQDYGNYGGFLGGTIGTVLSFVAVVLVYKTFHLQKKELEETKSLLKSQTFESTFFHMLDMLSSIARDLDKSSKDKFFTTFGDNLRYYFNVGSGNTKFMEYIYSELIADKESLEKLKDAYTDDSNEYPYFYGDVYDEDLSRQIYKWVNASDANYELYVGRIFSFVYDKSGARTSHYFRHMYQLFKLIISQFPKKEEEKLRRFYINLVVAQLSANQLVVLFYNCLSDEGLSYSGDVPEQKFRKIVTEYGMMDNTDRNLLMNESHCKRFYYYE
jgi:hypothetical protein